MSPIEKITIRNFWIAIISAIAFVIITNVFGVFDRISGTAKKVEQLELMKMDKEDANQYFNSLQTLLATQTAIWTQYMISNEKDKERMIKELETIQADIKELIRSQQKTRGNETPDFLRQSK